MKNIFRFLGLGIIVLTLFVPLTAYSVYAENNMFQAEIEKAITQAVEAWIGGDSKGLKRAMERLVRNETYLLAIGQSTKERSYLARVPKYLNKNPNAIGAYLFLIRKEKEGVVLFPISMYAGKRFKFGQK